MEPAKEEEYRRFHRSSAAERAGRWRRAPRGAGRQAKGPAACGLVSRYSRAGGDGRGDRAGQPGFLPDAGPVSAGRNRVSRSSISRNPVWSRARGRRVGHPLTRPRSAAGNRACGQASWLMAVDGVPPPSRSRRGGSGDAGHTPPSWRWQGDAPAGGRLANYSGGTAPDLHRISFSARRAARYRHRSRRQGRRATGRTGRLRATDRQVWIRLLMRLS